MKITITQEISLERIHDMLVSALEGGSNYWYMIEKKIEPKKWEFDTFKEDKTHYLGDYPLNLGGALIVTNERGLEGDDELVTKRLGMGAIQKGLELMAKKEPKAFADFMQENDDAETADIFLQLCVLGEVIYG